MKLFEIIDLQTRRQTQHRKQGGDVETAFQDMPGDELSAGNIEGFVKAHEKDPNKVNKIVRIPASGHAPYLDFLNVALKHQDNPFFPKIYHAKRYDDHSSGESVFIQAERLHELDDFEFRKHTVAIMNQLGIELTDADFRNRIWVVKIFEAFETSKGRAKLVEKSTNPQFKQAMKAIEPLLRKYKSDMHGQNFMFRTGGGEPHLVIIDPLNPLEHDWD